MKIQFSNHPQKRTLPKSTHQQRVWKTYDRCYNTCSYKAAGSTGWRQNFSEEMAFLRKRTVLLISECDENFPLGFPRRTVVTGMEE